jgi:hypothetical protein
MKKLLILLLFVIPFASAQAQSQITYTGQPDEIAVFLNNIAFAQEEITLPGGVDVAVSLPREVFPDTIVLREGERRVRDYRVRVGAEAVTVSWRSADTDDARTVTLTYLMTGIGWTPRYDMWLGESDETVGFDFFAEITNNVLPLDDVAVTLVAGRVDTSQQIDDISRITTNQFIAGYEQAPASSSFSGEVTVQHIYALEAISAEPGEIIYREMISTDLDARRLLVWNAFADQQVDVIYKVRNQTEMPFSEGIVRSYEDDLFIGSDFIELTPIGGEGSVTVGDLQDVRVNRGVTRTAILGARDTQVDVTLSLTNFSAETLTIEIVDRYPQDAVNFEFSQEPERQAGNLFRWEVTIEPGVELEITYGYQED